MKTCTKCGDTKPVTEFYRSKNVKSGHMAECADCVRARTAQRQRERRGGLLAPLAHDPDPLNDAYFAGFFDGEGSVGIQKCPAPSYFLLSVQVSNTVPEPLFALKTRFAGSVVGPSDRGPRHKPIYTWKCEAAKAEAFLRAVQPYLIIKRERVQLALEFRELFRGEHVIPRGHALESPRHQAKRDRILRTREGCFERMRVLNKRGVPDE